MFISPKRHFSIKRLSLMYYGPVEPFKWTRKHSFIMLFILVFFISSGPGMSAFVDSIPPNFSGVVTYHGFPLIWLIAYDGTYFRYDFNFLNLILDLGLFGTISSVIVYPRKIVHLFKRALKRKQFKKLLD